MAAGRLMEALVNNGVKAKMLVRDKETSRITVITNQTSWLKRQWDFVFERLCIYLRNGFSYKRVFLADIANTGADITRMEEFRKADVIHLHWVNHGMLSLSDIERILKSGKRVVWTMHDLWTATGICHYAGTCEAFKTECRSCPVLTPGGKGRDLSTTIFRRKQKLYASGRITFVTCSQWLRREAVQSGLMQGQEVVSIPNAIDTQKFRPADKTEARHRRGLPTHQTLLLFGSVKVSDERKGFAYLVQACQILAHQHPELRQKLAVVVVGSHVEEVEHQLPFEVWKQGYVAEEQAMAEVYAAADIYVTPSLEDNLPNTIMEAMACGIPCVGFNTGGIPEMIDHEKNGYVARYRDAEDLAQGILYCMEPSRRDDLSREAVRKTQRCWSQQSVAKQYLDVYEDKGFKTDTVKTDTITAEADKDKTDKE